jgi:hypothetical protein
MGRWRTHHSVWRIAAGLTVALGLGCAVVVWGFWGPVASSAAFFLPGFLISLAAARGVRASLRAGSWTAMGLMAAAGLLAALGWSGAFLLLMLVVTSPVAGLLLRTARLEPPAEMAVPEDAVALSDSTLLPDNQLPGVLDVDAVRTLDDEALCHAWRRSFVRLESSRGADVRLEVVGLRQLYLDELVRRHPAEVQEWLSSGARAAGNPLPFLVRRSPDEDAAEGAEEAAADGEVDDPGSG